MTVEVLAKRLRKQARSCKTLGSDLYAFLLERAAEDVEACGPTYDVMAPFATEPSGAAIALKLMGSVHRLVLEHRAPELAMFYPSVGGEGRVEDAWGPFRSVLVEHEDEIATLMKRNVQTNEVGRTAALLGGFLEVAERTGMPLRIMEIGCSAGLNLRWDHYRYEAAGEGWGDEDSPVVLRGFASAPDLDRDATVVERKGCDPDPIDAATAEGRLTLSAYVWPDQHWRWEQLRGAMAVAADVPVEIVRSGAADFLASELAEPRPGCATVVYHSIVIQYIEEQERQRVLETIVGAGAAATSEAPFAWLRMEPPLGILKWPDDVRTAWEPFLPHDDPDNETFRDLAAVHLTLWPGGTTETIARAGYHGRPIYAL